ncbi:helix-turn-helix domain-containing protein [Nitrosococcus watsonii]|uniref:helix-turn-helix domain-containing protein n=1 Tax=Nitrosococcus watsonii TaxID=473531 RepID=UPI00030FB6AC|nr:winged helix-turn-helix domain-containing protein [Nitrosococcus watsonii]
MAEHFGVSYSLSGLYEVLRRAGLSWVSARSRHPQRDGQVQEAFKKLRRAGSGRIARGGGAPEGGYLVSG